MSKSSYKFLNITLLESNFKRELGIDYQDQSFKNNIEIGIEHQKEGDKLFIILSVIFTAGIEKNKKQINALVKMLGVFEYIEGDELSTKDFAKINGPAIIFPFVREHLASISLKAGITPILLQPVNFVQLAKDDKPINQ